MIRYADEARGKPLKATPRWIDVFRNRRNTHLKSSSVEELLNRALSHLTMGEDDKAIDDATEALGLDSERAEAYRTRALIYMGKNQFDKAITDVNEAIRLDPGYAEAFGIRASVHTSKERFDSAISDWTSAIELKPTYGDAYCGRAFAYVKTGDFEKAIDDATDTIRLDPADADAYCARGLALSAKNELDKAIRDFCEAIRLNPGHANAYCARAAAHNMNGERDKAFADATEAARLEPGCADAYWHRGVAYRAKGDRGKAFADFARAEDTRSVSSTESPSSEEPDITEGFSREQWQERYREAIYEVERRRRNDVIQSHKNKRRFARTYFSIVKDLSQTMARVRQEIAKEEYTFFTATGIPDGVITPEMAEEMLRTWRIAVRSQLHRLALHFQLRWNDEIQKHRPRIGRIGLLREFSSASLDHRSRRSK